jgi:hypothetical protein
MTCNARLEVHHLMEAKSMLAGDRKGIAAARLVLLLLA